MFYMGDSSGKKGNEHKIMYKPTSCELPQMKGMNW